MAHRFNMHMQKKTPKPHARERTWSRWRINHAIKNKTDEVRQSKIEELKEKARERVATLFGIRKSDSDLVIKEK